MSDESALHPGSEVLLLEDDAALRKRLSARLRSLGAEVTEAGRIEEARRLLADVRFDFVLMDLHLPDGPGREIIERLRATSDHPRLPIVVLSADATHDQIDAAMSAGADAYLTKPLDVSDLLSTVVAALPS